MTLTVTEATFIGGATLSSSTLKKKCQISHLIFEKISIEYGNRLTGAAGPVLQITYVMLGTSDLYHILNT